MNRIISLLALMATLTGALYAQDVKDKQMVIKMNDNTEQVYDINNVKEITFIDKQVSTPSELPIMLFSDDDAAKIREHETNLGRIYNESITYGNKTYPGYLNIDLPVITGAIYNLDGPENQIDRLILAFGREEIDNCPKLETMLKKAGFTGGEISKHPTYGTKIRSWQKGLIMLTAFESNKNQLNAKTDLIFSSPAEHDPVKPLHGVIQDAKDFPALSFFESKKDLDKLKDAEETIGYRYYNYHPGYDGVAYNFRTKNDKMNKSNFTEMYYVYQMQGTPTYEIMCSLNCISSVKDAIGNKSFTQWLHNNGFDGTWEHRRWGQTGLEAAVLTTKQYEIAVYYNPLSKEMMMHIIQIK